MIKKEWDLKKLYKSPKDSQIDKDVAAFERKARAFRRKYYNKVDKLTTPSKLKPALSKYINILNHEGVIKAPYYFWLQSRINSFDNEVQRKLFSCEEKVTKIINEINFFRIELGKFSKGDQKKVIKGLPEYKYLLEQVFDRAKHNLSEKEEKIISLEYQSSYSLWVEGVKKSLSKKTVKFGRKDIPLEEALSMISNLPKKKRRDLYKKH